MPLSGGGADKYGNQYESWWTIVRLMDVLSGSAHSITLEPVGPEGEGVEFIVRQGADSWYEQVKSGTSRATWSFERLEAEILSKIVPHLKSGHRARLVLASPAPKFEKIIEQAQSLTSDAGQGTGPLDEESLSFLAGRWDIAITDVAATLSRIVIEHHPRASLQRLVESRVEAAILGDMNLVVRALHGWLFDQIHRTVFADDIRDFLRESGFEARDLRGDQATAISLARTTEAFERRVHDSSGTEPVLLRREVTGVVDAFRGAARCALIHGRPGSGKSQIVQQVLTEFGDWRRAVLRMDTIQTTTLTADQLGRELGLAGSPTALLGGLAGAGPSILVIDQLDAVSSFGGRLTESFDAIAEMLQASAAWPNMRVLLSVRTIDLQEDPRILAVASSANCAVVEIEDLTDAEVDTFLQDTPIRLNTFPIPDQRLLRLPLHLRLLREAHTELEPHETLTVTALFDALEARVRRVAAPGIDVQSWTRTLDQVAHSMSNSERLSLRTTSLAAFEPAVTELVAAGLLTQGGGLTSFFHERFFDHVFARGFIDRGDDLVEFLRHSGQALYRRSQTRQILQRTRDMQSRVFFDVCLRLIEDTSIRIHLKQIVIEALSSSAPTPTDWLNLSRLAGSNGYLGDEVRGLLRYPAWFDAAMASGDLTLRLETDHGDQIARFVLQNLEDRHTHVAKLMTPYIGDTRAAPWFRDVLEQGRFKGAFDFVAILVEAGYLDSETDPVAISNAAWFASYRFDDDDPDALRWLGLILNRALTLTQTQQLTDPFKEGIINDGGHVSNNIEKMGHSRPQEFLQAVLPFMVKTAVMTAAPDAESFDRSRWDHYFAPSVHDLDDMLMSGTLSAIGTIAVSDAGFHQVIDTVGEPTTALAAYLVARAHLAHDDPDRGLAWLTGDLKNLRLGWDGLSYGPACELIAAFASRSSPAVVLDLLSIVHAEVSDFERSTYGWRRRGLAEWQLLLAFPVESLPTSSRLRREELIRKFGDVPRERSRVTGGVVGSPVPQSASSRMTDAQWVRAMAKYDQQGVDHEADFLKGGSRELAQLLERQAAEEPLRFLELGLHQIPASAAPEYLGHLVSGLAGNVSAEELTALILRSRAIHGEKVGKTIAWAADKCSGPWPTELIGVVASLTLDSDPGPNAATFTSNNDSLGSRLTMAGLNCTRGAAAHALARHLWGKPTEIDGSLESALRRLVVDPAESVRASSCSALGALTHVDRAMALDLSNELFAHGVGPVATQAGYILLRYLVMQDADRFMPLVAAAISASDPETTKFAGAIWATLKFHDVLPMDSFEQFESLPEGVRIGVAWAWCSSDPPEVDRALQVLQDPASLVRAEAHHAIKSMTAISTAELETLVDAGMNGSNFTEMMSPLTDLMSQFLNELPANTLNLVQRVLALDDLDERTDMSRREATMLPSLLKVVLRLSRQNPQLYGEAALDCVDALVQTRSARMLRLIDVDDEFHE